MADHMTDPPLLDQDRKPPAYASRVGQDEAVKANRRLIAEEVTKLLKLSRLPPQPRGLTLGSIMRLVRDTELLAAAAGIKSTTNPEER